MKNAMINQLDGVAYVANKKIEDLKVEVGVAEGKIQQLKEQITHEQAAAIATDGDLRDLAEKLELEVNLSRAYKTQKDEANREKEEAIRAKEEAIQAKNEYAAKNAELAKSVSEWKRKAKARNAEIKSLKDQIAILQQPKGIL